MLREGMDEGFTVTRPGLTGRLLNSLYSTNCVESKVEHHPPSVPQREGLPGRRHARALAGEGSEFRSAGLCVGRGSQHFDIQTLQDHMARGAVSDLLYRAAVAERSRSVFAGLIRVEEGAQKTNAYVQNRNLLLSPTAKADSNPTLEILANDVRCTHGTAC